MSRDSLGTFEQAVLLGILDAGADAYGARVMDHVEKRLEKGVAIGALYVTLDRLERKGFVKARDGDPTPQRGGRPRRYFKVTAAGAAALKESQSATARLWRGVRLAGARV